MNDIKNTSPEIKLHPGQAGSDDDSRLKRTKTFEINLSPLEFDKFKNEWRKTDFNSMAKFARYKLFAALSIKLIYILKIKETIESLQPNIFPN